jgi:hypothetical protein
MHLPLGYGMQTKPQASHSVFTCLLASRLVMVFVRLLNTTLSDTSRATTQTQDKILDFVK